MPLDVSRQVWHLHQMYLVHTLCPITSFNVAVCCIFCDQYHWTFWCIWLQMGFESYQRGKSYGFRRLISSHMDSYNKCMVFLFFCGAWQYKSPSTLIVWKQADWTFFQTSPFVFQLKKKKKIIIQGWNSIRVNK